MARIRKIEIQHFRAIQAFTWLDGASLFPHHQVIDMPPKLVK
jgi:hypothetical protein